ncbi:MAG TPA: hypothetical protein GX396_07890 [Tissierellia bacterium]|nr:hypothetical protein [Tissierellia bacterium]
MKDLEKYLSFIKDEEAKNTVKKIARKGIVVNKNYVPEVTEFINPHLVQLCIPVIQNNVKFEIFPSFEQSERKVFILYPEYCEKPEVNDFLCGIRIHNKSKFKKLNHRDYLGALMSLGIERKRVGDIYVYETYGDIVVHTDIADYIIYNLDKIGRNKVEGEIIKVEEVSYKEQEHVLMEIHSSSMRIDNIVKHITNSSREKASNIIKSGNVKVNFLPEDRVSIELKEGDLLSISKEGRFKIHKIKGKTRSGRIKIEIKQYI